MKRKLYIPRSKISSVLSSGERKLVLYALVGALKILCRNACQISFMWGAITFVTNTSVDLRLYGVIVAFLLSAVVYAFTALRMPKITNWVQSYANTTKLTKNYVRKTVVVWQLVFLVLFWMVVLLIIDWKASLCCLFLALTLFYLFGAIRFVEYLFRIMTSPILMTISIFLLYATLLISIDNVGEHVLLFVVFLCLRQFSGVLAALLRSIGLMVVRNETSTE